MFLRHRQSGDLVEVLDFGSMIDPCQDRLPGRLHAGEEMQDPAVFRKEELAFPSGEALPQCWVDAKYRSETTAH